MGPRLWSTALWLEKSEFSVWPRELHCGLVYVASNTFLAVLLRIGWPSIVIWVFLWPSSYTVLCGVSCEEMGPGGWKGATAWGAHLSSPMRVQTQVQFRDLCQPFKRLKARGATAFMQSLGTILQGVFEEIECEPTLMADILIGNKPWALIADLRIALGR